MNNFAISSSGIGDALQRSASSLVAAGNTLDESIGMITAMNEIVQDPDIVGTSLKTLTMYLRAAKAEAEEAGIATDGMANSVSKLRGSILSLTGNRVDIMLDENTFKSTYQIMKELSEIWESLTDIDQAAILELIGGKRNANTISSLLKNFDTAIAATEAASDSFGSAMAENEKYLDSINGKLSQFRASFEALSGIIVNSSLVKGVISIGTALLNVLTVLTKIPGILAIVVAGLATLSSPGTKNVFASMLTGIGESIPLLSTLTGKLKELFKLTNSGIPAGSNILGATFGGVNKWVIGITALISLVNWGFQQYKQWIQESIDAAESIKSTYTESKESYQENTKALEDMRDRYDELSKGVDENGENVSLTASEYDEYRDIIERVAELSPSLIQGYTDEGVALNSYIGVIDAAIQAQKDLAQASKDAYLGSGETLFKGNAARYNNAEQSMRDAGMNMLEKMGVFDGSYDDTIYKQTLRSILDNFGIENYTFESLTAADYAKIYENAGEFVHLLREEVEETGIYTETVIGDIEEAVKGLSGAWKDMRSIERENAGFLIESLVESDVLGDGIRELPREIMDELQEGLSGVINPYEGMSLQREDAVAYINDLVKILSSDKGKAISEMSAGLKDGTISVEEYNAAVKELETEFAGSSALPTAIDFFEGISDSAKKAADDVNQLNTETRGLSAILDASSKNQTIMAKAIEEQNSKGYISNDTIKDIESVLGDSENLSDYINVQGDKLTLNAEAWAARTAKMWEDEIKALNNANTLLMEKNAELAGKKAAAQAYIEDSFTYNPADHGGYTWENADAASAAIDSCTRSIEQNSESIAVNNGMIAINDAARKNEGVEAVNTSKKIQDATSLAQNASDIILQSRNDLEEYGTLQSETIGKIAEYLGDEAENIANYIGEGGNTFDETLFKTFTTGKIDEYGAAIDIVRDKLVAMLNVDTNANPFDVLTEALYNANKAVDIFNAAKQDMAEGGVISSDTITALQDLFKEKWVDYVQEAPDGNGYVLLGEDLKTFAEGELTAAEAGQMLIATIMAGFSGTPDTTRLDGITNALNAVSKASGLANDIATELATNGASSIETLSSVIDFAGEDFTNNIDKYLTFTDKGFEISTKAITDHAGKIIDALGIEDETYKKLLRDRLEYVTEKQLEISRITSTLGSVGSNSSLIRSINQELEESGTNSLDTLSSFIEAYGDGWEDQVDFSNGIKISTEAIRELTLSKIDDLAISDERKKALKAEAEASMIQAEANANLAESYSAIKEASSMHGSYAHGEELTYDAYQKLIEADSRYAYAVEYQNGVMTLNAEKHAEVTQAVLDEQAALALLEAEKISSDERYVYLTEHIGELSDAEQDELDGLNAKIMGYSVLATELTNANDALNQFINSSDRASTVGYDELGNAFKTIKDVTENADSEMYGRIGHEKYKSALKLLISPEIEIGSDEYKRQMKTLERYVAEDGQGITNFYNDMIKNGLLDTTTGLNTNLDTMAEKMGLTTEALSLLIGELNTYQDDDHKIEVNYEQTGASDAKEDMNGISTAAENAKTPLQSALDTVSSIKTAQDDINAKSLDIKVKSSVQQGLQNVSDKLTGILSKLQAIANVGTVQANVRVNEESSSSPSGIISGLWNRLTGKTNAMAYASGTNRAYGGMTLVGELGRETVVDPASNRWYTVGDNGPEFVKLPKNAIVFNAEQTKDLFSAGRTREQGQSMASGNAAVSLISNIQNLFKTGAKKLVNTAVNSLLNATNHTNGKSPNANGNPLRPMTGSSSGKKKKGGGGGSSSLDDTTSTEEELTELEKLKKKYDEINDATEHLIEHQEHIYKVSEKGLNYDGMNAALTEQAKLYRQIMSDSQKSITEMIAAGGKDTDEELQSMEEAYWSAYDSLFDTLDQINNLYVDALHDKIDGIQSAYDGLRKAADEFNSYGGISVDSFQAILENGAQYLSLLDNIGGKYVINEDGIKRMIAAEKDQLAVETALSYISQVRQALADREEGKLKNLVDLSNSIGDSTWDIVYAQAELLKSAGLTGDQYAAVVSNINAVRDLANGVITDVSGKAEKAYKDREQANKDQLNSLDQIIKYVQDLIKYETEERIDAIKQQIDDYRKIIDLKKESLKTTKEENEYEKKVSDKVKEIAKLQAQIDQLSLDDSREARAERSSLIEKLKETQGALGDLQADHIYDMQSDTLDKQADSYEELRQTDIDALEESISSAEKLAQLALERIETELDTLYDELIDWNTEAGSVLNEEITENWNKAIEAIETYGSYAEALAKLKFATAEAGSNNTVVTDTNLLPKYHSGGVVGSKGSINGNEVVAILRKGETVVSGKMKDALYRIVDFQKALSDRLGVSIGKLSDIPSPSLSMATNGAIKTSPPPVTAKASNVFSPVVNVEINHSGQMDSHDAKSFGKEIADVTIGHMKDAFYQKGIGDVAGRKLRI